MNALPGKLNLSEWDDRYEQLRAGGLSEPAYGGPLRRHVIRERDFRLEQLRFDNSPACSPKTSACIRPAPAAAKSSAR